MINVLSIFLFIILIPAQAKVFSIKKGNALFELEADQYSHSIMVDAFINLEMLGRYKVLEKPVDGVITNFEKFEISSNSEQGTIGIEYQLDNERFDEKKFFSCVNDISKILYTTKLKKKLNLDDMLIQNEINRHRGAKNDLCSQFLGDKYHAVSDNDILMLIQMNKALKEKAELFHRLFLESQLKSDDTEKSIVLALLVKEMAFNILVRQGDMMTLEQHKLELVNAIKEREIAMNKISSNSKHIVKFDTVKLIDKIRSIK